jgi:DNA-binding response OmpR family regulator
MKALIVDDDRILADVVAFTLRREGYETIQAHDGESALRRFAEESPDLVILDVNMPRMDGFAVVQLIRQQSDTPIILLTVRHEENDIVAGLELGADDYMTKPFSPRQLAARAQAVLRRSQAGRAVAVSDTRRAGNLLLNTNRRELRVVTGDDEGNAASDPVNLTGLECRLLAYLMLNAGHVLTAEAIINHVWGAEGGDRDMLRQLVRRLRGKIRDVCDAAGEPSVRVPVIETIPGVGYGLTQELRGDKMTG